MPSPSRAAAFLGDLDLGPGPLVSPGLLADATRPWVTGHCPVLGEEGTSGLGFVPSSSRRCIFPSPRSFGHFGSGGAVGRADPEVGVAFGHVGIAATHTAPLAASGVQSGRGRAPRGPTWSRPPGSGSRGDQ